MVGVSSNLQTLYNYKSLTEKQSALEKKFGNTLARPDPDLSPEFNCPQADWR